MLLQRQSQAIANIFFFEEAIANIEMPIHVQSLLMRINFYKCNSCLLNGQQPLQENIRHAMTIITANS
jgi:hypothetical protein